MLLVLAGLAGMTASPARAQSTGAAAGGEVRVYLFRGFLGLAFSRGMDRLGERIRSSGVEARVTGFEFCSGAAEDAIGDYRRRPFTIAAIGHSLGGVCALSFSEKLADENIPVALAVTFDTTRIHPKVPNNIGRYINVFTSRSVLGAGDVQVPKGFRGSFASYNLVKHYDVNHLNIEKLGALHRQLIDKILGLRDVSGGGAALPIRLKVPADAPIELWDGGEIVQAQAGDTLESIAAARSVPLWAVSQLNSVPPGQPLSGGAQIVVPGSTGDPGSR
ncbi:MAG: peptidoglycan-binding protein LysM [Rhizobiaceae bacterium]|nr:MAG: peptidoglycan-binding protein LysM [Rhizobiaceae bacterium]CAG0973197.1 hypothetical protein RHIZO_01336 [Rhizobiaceae bacterium]